MAIDGDITIANLVTQALKNAGRVAPSATQITEATAYQFRRVKSDIATKSSTHDALRTTAVNATVDGQQRYSWPTDAHIVNAVTLLDGPDEWRGTATAGASTTITLAAGLDVSDSNTLKGKYIVTTGGTGPNQIRQITGWNNSTKVATVESAWVTNPASGTTYLIASDHRKLWSLDKVSDWSTIVNPGSRGKSYGAAMAGRQIWLEHTPDKVYVLWWDYYAHLDLLDNAGDVMLKHIRMYYSLWSQGITAWLCQRYDEDRYQTEMSAYNALLELYGAEASHVVAMQPHDV